MAERRNEDRDVFRIPQNFINDGTIMGGAFKLRNAIEAGILALGIGFPIAKLPLSLTWIICIECITALPAAFIALIGIDGQSLSSFLMAVIKFFRNKRTISNDWDMRQNKATEEKEEEEETAPTLKDKLNALKAFNNGKEKEPKEKRFERETPVGPMAQFIPIKDIRNGIIITQDYRYLKIIEISPINFNLRSVREQRDIIYSFISYLKIAPSRIQFKIIAKKAETDKHLKRINEEMAAETDDRVRALQEDYANLLQTVGSKEATTRRFFIIFEYEGIGGRRGGEDEAIIELHNDVNTAASYLRQCGNEVIQYENDNDFTLELLYSLLNRDKSESADYERRIANIAARQMFENGIAYHATDIIAPESIKIEKPNYVDCGGVLHSYVMISANGYKPLVCAGWLSLIVNAGDGIDMDIFVNREYKEQIQRKLTHQLLINKSKLKDASDTNTDFDDLDSAISSGYFIKNGLANNLDFYYINILITVTATNEGELERRMNALNQMLVSQDIQTVSCNFQQEQAFISALPLNKLDKKLFERSKRNMLTDSVASCYPFTSYEICDDNGILLGTNKSNQSLVIVDIFDSKKYKNANMAILGTSGSGKTFTMQLMALRMRRKDIQVFILAPLKGSEFYRACNKVGGEFIQISPSSPHCINIMEIRRIDTTTSDILDLPSINKSMLATKIQSLHIFFSLLIPDMSYEEKQLMDNALVETYRRAGITHNNDSLEDTYHPGHYKEMPILGDLYEVLCEEPETKRLATIVNRFVNGSARSFNQQTNVNLDNKYVVLDISELTGDMLTVGMFIALDFVWDKAKEDKTKKKAIFVDETWKLIGASSNKLAAEFVLEIFKIIRGYGGSAVCATQDINDFFALEDGKYGKGIINNSKTKIVLNLEEEEADRVQDILRLSDSETMDITHFERGNGLISANANNVEVEFKASELEKELITTDRNELKELVERKKKELETVEKEEMKAKIQTLITNENLQIDLEEISSDNLLD